MGQCNPCRVFESNPLPNYSKTSIKISKDIDKIMNNIDFNHPFDKTEIYLKESEIEKKYLKIQNLGSGMFSTVYLVKQPKGPKVAMKVIKKNEFKTEEDIRNIITEKELMKILNHRNILKLIETFQTHDKIYLITEYASKGFFMFFVLNK